MNERTRGIAIGAAAMLVGAGGAALAMGAGSNIGLGDKAAIERVVRDYVLAHPEIIPEAMERLRDRENAKLVAENRKALETPFAGAWAGAADGDVVLVEFTDYSCGYCRASVADVEKLLADDPGLKVVYREVPVIGADSEGAALAGLAAAKQGKHAAFHKALFASGRASADAVAQAFAATGVTGGAPTPEMIAEVESNARLYQTLGLSGTPSWIVGDKVISGAVGYDELKAAIAEARAKGA